MLTHNITTKPTHFERPQLSGFWKAKRDGLGTSSPRTQTRNPKRSSQNAHSLLFKEHPKTCPHCCLGILLLGNLLQHFTSSRIHACLVPDLGLSTKCHKLRRLAKEGTRRTCRPEMRTPFRLGFLASKLPATLHAAQGRTTKA